jgi:hypothetical protein
MMSTTLHNTHKPMEALAGAELQRTDTHEAHVRDLALGGPSSGDYARQRHAPRA